MESWLVRTTMAAWSSGKTMFSEVNPGNFASVLSAAMAVFFADNHAQTVSCAQAIFQNGIGGKGAIGIRLKETLIDDANVPLRQILRRHGEFAGRK